MDSNHPLFISGSIRDFIHHAANSEPWAWLIKWLPVGFEPASVIITTEGGTTRDIKTLEAPLPGGLIQLGWTGLGKNGLASWIGLDLDVNHGNPKDAYETTKEALEAARTVAVNLAPGTVEIRLSKSGNGVHLRHKLTDSIANETAKDYLACLVDDLEIRTDRAAMGRQSFWMWVHRPVEIAFKPFLELGQKYESPAAIRA